MSPSDNSAYCWKSSTKQFGGTRYTITNKQTNRQLAVVGTGVGDQRPVSPMWLAATHTFDGSRMFNIDNDSRETAVTILNRFGTIDGRYVWDGPNVRKYRNLCRLGVTKDQDVYFISADMTSNPPRVLADSGPSNLDWGTPNTAEYDCNKENQMWVIAKSPFGN